MTFLKIALAVYVLFLFPLSSLSAEPQGELYWMVDSNSEAEQAAMEINPPGLTTGSISGRVTNEDGNGIGEIYVTLHRSNPLAAFIQRVKTGSDGSYVLTELAEGSYKIRFHGQLYQTVYLEE